MKKLILLSCFLGKGNFFASSEEAENNTLVPNYFKSGMSKKLLKNLLLLCILIATTFSVFGQGTPATAAPDPLCDQADVISMFSNVYTDVTVDTWLTPWSAAPVTLTDLQIAGNDTKWYQDVTFLGIETVGPNLIDASGMTYFNLSFWSNNATQFRVKLVDFGPDMAFGGGDDSEHEITFDNPAQNEWICYSIPLTDFTGLANTNNIAQYILSAMPNTVADFYIDNVYFSNSNCIVAAPEPTCPAANVISMFSNSYTDVPVDTWLTPWSAAPVTLTDLDICGNDLKFYENVTFLGIETVGPNLIDASAMDNFNIDFWSGNATQFRVKLVDFGPDMAFGGGDDTEHELTFDNPAQNEWISYQLPLASFTGLLNTDNIAQLILSAMPNTVADFYIDNVYFSTCVAPVDIEFCVDLNCFNQAPQVPSVAGTFTTPLWNFGQYFLADPDMDGFWCATVSLAPGTYEYRFFDQIEGQEDLSGGGPCVTPGLNRSLTVVAGLPQNISVGWETCDPTCIPPLPPPDLPITFDDPGIDYNLINFGGMNSFLSVDPTNPANMVMCSNKTPGAQCWAGTVVGDAGLQNPIPFSPTNLVMTLDVYSPNAGTPILLKVEGTGTPSEVLAFTTVANTWETLVFDFATGFPGPPDLGQTYNKVVVFAEFTCSTTNALGSGLTYYFDNIQMCALPLLGITCPPDVTLTCTDPFPAVATDEASFLAQGGMIDNPCTNPVTVTGSDDQAVDVCGNVITRSYEVSDGTATFTCEQIITIAPPAAPTIVCPPDMTVTCEADIVVDAANAVVTTDCNLGFVTWVDQPHITGARDCDGTTYEYRYHVVDDCGVGAECIQTFTLLNDAPAISVIPGGNVECFDDIVVSTGDATVTTSCGEDLDITIYSPVINGEPDCPGTTYTFTFRVEDQCEREATADRVFTIQNTDDPIVTAPDNVTCECLAGVNAWPQNADVLTGCGVDADVAVSGPVISGPIDCPGTTYTYTYTATDACNRTGSDTQTFTVSNGPPVFINAPAGPLQLNCEDEGWEDIIQAWLASVKANTSCGQPLTVFNNYNPNSQGVCISNGVTNVTWRATDQCGRQSTVSSMVIIADTEPPVFVEEAQDELDICNYNTPHEFDAWVDAHGNSLALDGCDDNITPNQWSTIPNNPSFPNCMNVMGSSSVTVTFVVRDDCGNKSSSTATFTALMADGDLVENEGETVEAAQKLGFALNQNQPNPFKNETLIGFNLPEASSATLTVYGISGRIVKMVQGDYRAGYNEIQISSDELGSTGLLYYELKTATDHSVKKMILLD